MNHRAVINVGGRELQVTNLDKVLYPHSGFTKADVLDYYSRIAPVLLPHLEGRALTLKRYPDGVEGEYFYEKNSPAGRPPWVRTTPIWSERRGAPIQAPVADDLPSLVWAANLAALELHTSLARAAHPDRPTLLAFDLDPGPPADVLACARIAQQLRRMLEHLGLESFAKTSGGKGLHVYVPLNDPRATWALTKAFAHEVAQQLERTYPDLVVSRMAKALRGGRVFIDWSQNDAKKTTVCAYSLRAAERPTVSTPVTWNELDAAVRQGLPRRLSFEAGEVLLRAKRLGDPFEAVETLRQELPTGA